MNSIKINEKDNKSSDKNNKDSMNAAKAMAKSGDIEMAKEMYMNIYESTNSFEAGYNAGYELNGSLCIDRVLTGLDESQAGAQRHKSPHAAFALGYYHGVCQRTNDDN